jgi:hypothetical protein
MGTNNLKIYLGGILLRKGEGHDYLETSNNSFTMLRDLPIGVILEAEITTFTVMYLQLQEYQ